MTIYWVPHKSLQRTFLHCSASPTFLTSIRFTDLPNPRLHFSSAVVGPAVFSFDHLNGFISKLIKNNYDIDTNQNYSSVPTVWCDWVITRYRSIAGHWSKSKQSFFSSILFYVFCSYYGQCLTLWPNR